MSDKIYLKEITLPIVETGENETYSFVQTDADLDTAGDAADAKAVGDELTNLKQDLEGLDVYTLGLYPQKQIEDSAVASFADGADDIPVKSLTVDVTPVQDLHGQANPYPDGGGKNILPMTVAGIKAANTGASWSGNACTLNGVTFTIQTDAGGNVTGINVNGTASGDAPSLYLAKNVALANGSYTLNGCPSNGSLQSYGIFADYSSGGNVPDYGTGGSLTISGITLNIRVRIANGYSASNILFKPMIRLSSVSDATFAPYSNICPISGWTGANVSVAGVNLLSEYGVKVPIRIPANTQFRTSCHNGGQYTFVYFYDKDKTEITHYSMSTVDSTTGRTYRTFNVAYDIYYVMFGNVNQGDNQLTFGEEIAYHPYKGHVYEIDWTTKAGTVYGGTLDVTNGVLTVDRANLNLSTAEWSTLSSPSTHIFRTPLLDAKPSSHTQGTQTLPADAVMTNGYEAKGYTPLGASDDKCFAIGFVTGLDTMRLVVVDQSCSTVADFINAMTGVQCVYALETPQTYQLTPTEVATILGQNNIFCDTGDIAELTYRADLKAYIDEKLA